MKRYYGERAVFNPEDWQYGQRARWNPEPITLGLMAAVGLGVAYTLYSKVTGSSEVEEEEDEGPVETEEDFQEFIQPSPPNDPEFSTFNSEVAAMAPQGVSTAPVPPPENVSIESEKVDPRVKPKKSQRAFFHKAIRAIRKDLTKRYGLKGGAAKLRKKIKGFNPRSGHTIIMVWLKTLPDPRMHSDHLYSVNGRATKATLLKKAKKPTYKMVATQVSSPSTSSYKTPKPSSVMSFASYKSQKGLLMPGVALKSHPGYGPPYPPDSQVAATFPNISAGRYLNTTSLIKSILNNSGVMVQSSDLNDRTIESENATTGNRLVSFKLGQGAGVFKFWINFESSAATLDKAPAGFVPKYVPASFILVGVDGNDEPTPYKPWG